MAYCIVEDCPKPVDRDGLCFSHRIRTVAFAKGHLRNNLHPGLTMKESQDKIRADAAKNGYDAVPVDKG